MTSEIEDFKREAREEDLRAELHERMMRADIEYFCEYVVENTRLESKFLFDVANELRIICNKYEQDFSDLCDYIKSSV